MTLVFWRSHSNPERPHSQVLLLLRLQESD
jgi:hypothetical protein